MRVFSQEPQHAFTSRSSASRVWISTRVSNLNVGNLSSRIPKRDCRLTLLVAELVHCLLAHVARILRARARLRSFGTRHHLSASPACNIDDYIESGVEILERAPSLSAPPRPAAKLLQSRAVAQTAELHLGRVLTK